MMKGGPLPPHQAVENILGQVRRGEISIDRMRPWAERIDREGWLIQCESLVAHTPYFRLPLELFREVRDMVADDQQEEKA